MNPQRRQLVESLQRLAPAAKPSSTLPALPPAQPIVASTGLGTESPSGASGASGSGGGGLIAGAQSTRTLQSSDGLFAWTFNVVAVTLADGSVVNMVILP